MHKRFLSLEKVSVTINGKERLKEISFDMAESTCWAVVGPSGSGKSVLAQTLKGRHFFSGRIESSLGKPDDFFRLVSFVDQHTQFKDLNNRRQFYYQQRYNASDAANTITGGEDLVEWANENPAGPAFFLKETLLKIFDLERVLDEPLIQLSSGELKKLQVIKALIWNWKLLVLDQPMTGIDAGMRKVFDSLLSQLALAGKNILLITSPTEIPSWITHIAFLKNGELSAAGESKNMIHLIREFALMQSPLPHKLPNVPANEKYGSSHQLINLLGVSVSYGQKKVLDNISWEVKKGEKWSLSGPNGSGKSTLLSLICGDHPQAYANEIYLFGKKRGTGESIWDIKSNIGFLSAELQAYFDMGITCYDAIASGFFDTIGLFRPISREQHELVLKWLELLHLDKGMQLLLSLSPGFQRLVLLARAMIKSPPMLILDEPCQGLDIFQADELRKLVALYCKAPGSSLIYVTHYREEIPSEVTHFLSLEAGKILS